MSDQLCHARLAVPGLRAECILDAGHRSPDHWGPDGDGVPREWPVERTEVGA